MAVSYSLDFSWMASGLAVLWRGLSITILIALCANAIGVVAGFVVGMLTQSKSRLVRFPVSAFIEFFRCTPALVQVVWFFYCVPIIFNVFLTPVTMGILAISLNLSAFNAEAYRAGIQSVPRDQLDAGVALGFSPFQRTTLIVLPHAFRMAMPVLVTNGISALQQTSLLSVVAIQELMYRGKEIASDTYRPLEVFTTVGVMYLIVSVLAAHALRVIERKRSFNYSAA
jgi:polar amino acid transport system permease protein